MKIDAEFKAIIPPLTSEEYQQLEENIKVNGCLDSLKCWKYENDTILLDGHNRKEICERLNVPYDVEYIPLASRDEAILWIIDHQNARRNLTPFQRVELKSKKKDVLEKMAKEKQIVAGERGIEGGRGNKKKTLPANSPEGFNPSDKETREKIAKEANVGSNTVSRVEKILKKASEQLKEACRKGDVSINQAYKEVKRQERKEEALAFLVKKEILPPSGKYDVIVIDPPWPMQKIERDCSPNENVEMDYSTMPIEEIEKLVIPSEDNCHVFLWATHRFLPDALKLFSVWNVKYVCVFVWHKNGGFQPFGLPQYNCEFCIYGRIGTPIFIDTKDFFTCFVGDRGNHSEKPEEFYSVIRRVTGGKRLDMFNRRKIEGFDGWGYEAK